MRYEELFPNLECGPCMLEPVLAEVLHGESADHIEQVTLAEVIEVVGYYGNFTVKIRQAPRYVDPERCIGCNLCVPPCPASTPNEYNCGLDTRKAIAFPFLGALPNAPFVDPVVCLRKNGQDCRLCLEACPVKGAINFEDAERTLERKVGAIVVATGAGLYDCERLPGLGHGKLPGVYTSLELERLLAANGPTGGELHRPDGGPPASVAIVHCVGSLDERHRPYCSSVCCQYAFKFNHLIHKKLPEARTYHLCRELVMPGKDEFTLYRHVAGNPASVLLRYADIADVEVRASNGTHLLRYRGPDGKSGSLEADLVVLCPAIEPAATAGQLAEILDVPCDRFGFFEELHGRLDSARSKLKGVYIAGACQAPMNIQQAISQGLAAASYVLSGLAEGKRLPVEPVVAWADPEHCSGCKTCGAVCPYKAISYVADADGERAEVNALLCQGCGTCVAACPAGALQGRHFTTPQILAEIEAVLS